MGKEIKVSTDIITGNGVRGTFTSKQEIKQSPIQEDVITFTARGVSKDAAKWVRVYAAQEERTLGALVTEALQLLRKHYEQETR